MFPDDIIDGANQLLDNTNLSKTTIFGKSRSALEVDQPPGYTLSNTKASQFNQTSDQLQLQ